MRFSLSGYEPTSSPSEQLMSDDFGKMRCRRPASSRRLRNDSYRIRKGVGYLLGAVAGSDALSGYRFLWPWVPGSASIGARALDTSNYLFSPETLNVRKQIKCGVIGQQGDTLYDRLRREHPIKWIWMIHYETSGHERATNAVYLSVSLRNLSGNVAPGGFGW
jgi:hypothetical protein